MAEDNKWWQDVVGVIKDLTPTAAEIIKANNGTPTYVQPGSGSVATTPQIIIQQPAAAATDDSKKKDNTLLIVGIVGGVLVLCTVLYFALKK